ncbi:hypothetical protein [Aeromonas veronii]|uniref:hypothetical protein n=1 Tax=Aeromonas veronii TaxID=654 RepID=UPI001FD66199|nr:hypothetical protein [Aeromonas veronii]MCJ8214126.1 hypothetical protein [Aeromonas veronii]MCR3972387.1 hypothetical protein [Aeromonas veronii]MCR3973769.1 hypothetical protein [Aeromonas veronii]HDZ8978823.1 hypothetical protein [Aeromonas veronii]
MRWSERVKEWLLDLDVKLQRDPHALWPATLGCVIALALFIFAGIQISKLPVQAPMFAGMRDVMLILWATLVLVGLIIAAKGISATVGRLEKAGHIPD